MYVFVEKWEFFFLTEKKHLIKSFDKELRCQDFQLNMIEAMLLDLLRIIDMTSIWESVCVDMSSKLRLRSACTSVEPDQSLLSAHCMDREDWSDCIESRLLLK